MGTWDKVKEWFGIEKKKKENNADTSAYKDKEKELIDELEKMDKEYRESTNRPSIEDIMPETPGYEKIEFNGEPLEDILERVKQKYEKDKLAESKNVELSYKSKSDSVEAESKKTKEKQQSELEKLEQYLKESKEDHGNSMTNKGLSRSSIRSSGMEALTESFDQKKDSVNQDFENKLGEYARKLEELEQAQSIALEKLDLNFADKLQKEINSVKSQREKQIQDIDKYNNSIEEKTNTYKQNREETIRKEIADKIKNDKLLEEQENKIGYTGDKKVNYDKRLNAAVNFYNSLPKEVARQMVKENTNLQSYLGKNYGKLINAYA